MTKTRKDAAIEIIFMIDLPTEIYLNFISDIKERLWKTEQFQRTK